MGKIAPAFQKDKKSKTVLREAVWSKLNEEILGDDGSVTSYAEVMASRLVAMACYAESDKDAISAAKFIKEWFEGKPAVSDTTNKVDMPVVKFILNGQEASMIEDRALKPYEEEELDRVMVSIEGVDGEVEL